MRKANVPGAGERNAASSSSGGEAHFVLSPSFALAQTDEPRPVVELAWRYLVAKGPFASAE